MNNYELMVVIDPSLEDDKKTESLELIKDIIVQEKGELGEVDVWGMRKLAYPINKKNEGYYAVIQFKGGPELPTELDRRLRISENFMRHLIVNQDRA